MEIEQMEIYPLFLDNSTLQRCQFSLSELINVMQSQLDMLILKFIWKNKHVRIARKTLEKNNYTEDQLYQTLKHTIKFLLLKTVCYYAQANRPMNRIEGSETDPSTYGSWIEYLTRKRTLQGKLVTLN